MTFSQITAYIAVRILLTYVSAVRPNSLLCS